MENQSIVAFPKLKKGNSAKKQLDAKVQAKKLEAVALASGERKSVLTRQLSTKELEDLTRQLSKKEVKNIKKEVLLNAMHVQVLKYPCCGFFGTGISVLGLNILY
jgi:hypothetical protein